MCTARFPNSGGESTQPPDADSLPLNADPHRPGCRCPQVQTPARQTPPPGADPLGRIPLMLTAWMQIPLEADPPRQTLDGNFHIGRHPSLYEQAGVKTLPCPKLHLRTVKTVSGPSHISMHSKSELD